MSPEVKEFLVSQDYFVEISVDPTYNNVYYGRFPPNIFKQLSQLNLQYYIEDDQIICTNLGTKQSNKIFVTPISRRAVFLYDIILKANSRKFNLELILGTKNKKKVPIVDLIPQKENKKREKTLLNIFNNFLNNKEYQKDIEKHDLHRDFEPIYKLAELGGL